ncbi:fatty acid CoA ligase family protein [Desulfobacterales bacterium HSG16]|nr:fatty acid CoA ligase family protein [Desulfobacterales bacterium HSG16]
MNNLELVKRTEETEDAVIEDAVLEDAITEDDLELMEEKAEKTVNVANLLKEKVELHPFKRAVVFPAGWDEDNRVAYTHLTFLQLDEESDCLAHGLEHAGIKQGTRTVIMVRPCLEFFILTFALFKTGAVPVMVDPGMGKRNMVRCIEQSQAEAFIGIPYAHLLRYLFPGHFKSIKTWIKAGKSRFGMGKTLEKISKKPWKPYHVAQTMKNETAAILFTTGSTGPAKGVIYTHGMFDAQISAIKTHFDFGPDEIDLPTFPLFSLFDPALGMTAVIPDMDPTMPAKANPVKIIEAITDQGVTNMFASPALLHRLGSYGKDNNTSLPTLRRVVSAGAPVSPDNIETFSAMLNSDVQIHTPYGATESLPVMSIGSNEILSDTRKFSEMGYGICVGRPVCDIEVRIIKITDDPIEQWSGNLLVESGDIGEITVTGELVSKGYFKDMESDLLSKIKDGSTIWHRMGDLGWKDRHNRVWFCGRKAHRVTTKKGDLYSIPCEAIFNRHPGVYRSALVGKGDSPKQEPVICIELNLGGKSIDKEQVRRELLNEAVKNEMTKDIKTIFFHSGFPVDIRHNSKIFREKLAKWIK